MARRGVRIGRTARLAGVLVLLALLTTASLLGQPLRLATAWLYDGEPSVPSDLLVVLGGGSHERAHTALGLYRQGMAPAILITGGYGFPDSMMRYLESEGIPSRALLAPVRPSTSTWEDALSIRDIVLRRHARSVLVVTSPYHCRRTRLILRRALSDLDLRISVTPSVSLYMNPGHWWRSRQGWITVGPEFPKLLWAWLTTSRAGRGGPPGRRQVTEDP